MLFPQEKDFLQKKCSEMETQLSDTTGRLAAEESSSEAFKAHYCELQAQVEALGVRLEAEELARAEVEALGAQEQASSRCGATWVPIPEKAYLMQSTHRVLSRELVNKINAALQRCRADGLEAEQLAAEQRMKAEGLERRVQALQSQVDVAHEVLIRIRERKRFKVCWQGCLLCCMRCSGQDDFAGSGSSW